MHCSALRFCYPTRIAIPYKNVDPITMRKRAKDKNYEDKVKYTGNPPPSEASKANLKRPLGRPSVKSRVVDSRITRNKHAVNDFIIHPHRDWSNGLESRDNFPATNADEYGNTTHMLTIPITNDGIRSRATLVQEEMLKYGKSVERLFIPPHKMCIEFLPFRLVQNDEFSTAELQKALLELIEKKSEGTPAISARVHGLRTFADGRVLFAALTANVGVKHLYTLQREVLREIYERKRCLAKRTDCDAQALREVQRKYCHPIQNDNRCWMHIVPQINTFDYFQPHLRIARANYRPEEYKDLSLLFDKVPYPSYVQFINEFFGDQKVNTFELKTIAEGDVSSESVGTAYLGRSRSNDGISDFLKQNVNGGLPLDLLQRSSGNSFISQME